MTDTIFALSTGRLPSGVAVLRLSGPVVRDALAALVGEVPEPRFAKYAKIKAADGTLIDRGLVLFFPRPHSFTGEDCAELHVHGSVATVAACVSVLGAMPGLRQAEAGEFTKRAFWNGRIDLTEAEGLADLIAAETEAQRLQALSNAEGAQRKLYEAWRAQILHARAMIEAEIDFTDEGDVPGSVSAQIWPQIDQLAIEVMAHAGRARSGEIVRSGLDVVILGAPNAGKSTLMNALSRRDVSIITDVPGTTRDLVEVRLDLGGYRINLVDTAGIRTEAGRVEAIGIQRAQERAQGAHLVLLVEDVSDPGSAPSAPVACVCWRIGLKSDLVDATRGGAYDLVVSVQDGSGMDELMNRLTEFVLTQAGGPGDVTPVRQRQVDELRQCERRLRAAFVARNRGIEIAAEELRLAGDALARLTGRIDVEEMLGVIFSQFCVGK